MEPELTNIHHRHLAAVAERAGDVAVVCPAGGDWIMRRIRRAFAKVRVVLELSGSQRWLRTSGIRLRETMPSGCERRHQIPTRSHTLQSAMRSFTRILALPVGMAQFLASTATNAQQTPQQAPPSGPGAYRLIRYEEDYRYLQDPTRRSDPWDPIKYIRIGQDPGNFLSLGGELRERLEYYSAPNFGLTRIGPNGYLLQRMLVHADLHLGDNFRAFTQFGHHLAMGQEATSSVYTDRFDLQQAFVDLRFPIAPSVGIEPILRIGRQEMVFGSQRLVAIRDAPNVRRSFDGVRLSDTIGDVRLDAFVARPVLLQQGVFDDSSNRAQAFWGAYATLPLRFVPGLNIDLYYLGLNNERARFAPASGNERRHTVGMRLFGTAAGWDWDWEALWQFGTLAAQDVRAWGASTDTGYTFNLAGWRLRVGLKADTASGDHNPRDGKLGTLNPLFPKLAYYNEAALFAPSNVIDVVPTFSIMPASNVAVTAGYGFFWRADTSDAIYTGTLTPVPGTAGRGRRFTGRQFSIGVTWQFDRHLQFGAGYVRTDIGQALRAAGGRDVDFMYASAAYRF
jgi:hypothetical protein